MTKNAPVVPCRMITSICGAVLSAAGLGGAGGRAPFVSGIQGLT
jgi:hypothetical protein